MLDAQIARRFGPLREAVLRRHAAGWRGEPRHLLAAVILLDQFSRNLFRGDARAFEADPLARALSGEADARGWGVALTPLERQFLWMPFMHAETMEGQARSLRLFGADGDDAVIGFATAHARQVARFGRFPQRNAALGRTSPAAEGAGLDDPANRF